MDAFIQMWLVGQMSKHQLFVQENIFFERLLHRTILNI